MANLGNLIYKCNYTNIDTGVKKGIEQRQKAKARATQIEKSSKR